MNEDLLAMLAQELALMGDCSDVLNQSYKRCHGLAVAGKKTPEQLERLEALTNRFARLSDILVQKVLRTAVWWTTLKHS